MSVVVEISRNLFETAEKEGKLVAFIGTAGVQSELTWPDFHQRATVVDPQHGCTA